MESATLEQATRSFSLDKIGETELSPAKTREEKARENWNKLSIADRTISFDVIDLFGDFIEMGHPAEWQKRLLIADVLRERALQKFGNSSFFSIVPEEQKKYFEPLNRPKPMRSRPDRRHLLFYCGAALTATPAELKYFCDNLVPDSSGLYSAEQQPFMERCKDVLRAELKHEPSVDELTSKYFTEDHTGGIYTFYYGMAFFEIPGAKERVQVKCTNIPYLATHLDANNVLYYEEVNLLKPEDITRKLNEAADARRERWRKKR